jgi:hypothetical protein
VIVSRSSHLVVRLVDGRGKSLKTTFTREVTAIADDSFVDQTFRGVGVWELAIFWR